MAVQISGNDITVPRDTTVTRNLTVGGVLTYEDVTNVDSIGIVTARAGVLVGSGITLSKDGDIFATGVTTSTTFSGNFSGGTVSGTTGTFSGAVQTVGLTNTIASGNVIALLDSSNASQNHRVRINSQGASSSTSLAISNSNANNQTSLVHGNDGVFSIRSGQTAGSEPTSGSERIRIDTTGRLLLNTTTEGNAGADDFTIGQISGSTGITIRSGTTNNGNLYFSDGTSGDDEYRGSIQYQHANNSLHIATNAVERLLIDSSGRLLLGTTTEGHGDADEFTIANTGGANMGMTIRSGTGALGNIFFSDGTSGGSEYRGMIQYGHNNDSMRFATAETERMRIDSSGRLLLGTTTAGESNGDEATFANTGGNAGITIRSAVDAECKIYFSEGTSGGSQYRGAINYNQNSNYMSFSANEAERMRLNTSGNLTVGTTNDDGGGASNTDNGVVLKHDGQVICRRNDVMYTAKSIATGGYTAFRTMSAQTQVGSITFNSAGTSFNTSSDYRRKENIIDLTGAIARLKTLLPKRFNFIDEPSVTRDGFLAHEVTTVPEAVWGTKDAVEPEDNEKNGVKKGDPIYQQLDQSKLVPLLTAALQEAVTEIESLKARLDAAGL